MSGAVKGPFVKSVLKPGGYQAGGDEQQSDYQHQVEEEI